MSNYKVLSTKKLDASLVQQAKENNIEIIEQKFISIEPIFNQEKSNEVSQLLKKPYAVFTSANAVSTIDKYLQSYDSYFVISWEMFCLSGKTNKAISDSLVLPKNIIGEADNASELGKTIINRGIKEVVFFCGNKRRDELPAILKDAGIIVYEVVVYETIETPIAMDDDFDAVLFFSPSAVQSFFSVNQLNKNTVCFAIGKTTANNISDFTDNTIIISDSPDQGMMLKSVKFYFDNINCYE